MTQEREADTEAQNQHFEAQLNAPLVAEFGEQLYARRVELGATQGELGATAGLSAAYISEIENGRRLPPPRRTAVRLAKALQLTSTSADLLVAAAVRGRGSGRTDEELPNEVRHLITDLRVYAFQLPARFVAALRRQIKEIVM